jgi:hypothetical protein
MQTRSVSTNTLKHSLTILPTLLLVPLAALHAADGQPAKPTAKPNIILILVDDLGYGGKLVPTPAIDSLARDGVRCTDGYVTAPLCAPSRCGLMIGAYNQRFGMQWNKTSSAAAVNRGDIGSTALILEYLVDRSRFRPFRIGCEKEFCHQQDGGDRVDRFHFHG